MKIKQILLNETESNKSNLKYSDLKDAQFSTRVLYIHNLLVHDSQTVTFFVHFFFKFFELSESHSSGSIWHSTLHVCVCVCCAIWTIVSCMLGCITISSNVICSIKNINSMKLKNRVDNKIFVQYLLTHPGCLDGRHF